MTPIRWTLSAPTSRHADTVATALDGKEALAWLEEVRPLVVLLDVMMPGMDGWEVARVIKNHPEFSNVRVVMLTRAAISPTSTKVCAQARMTIS